MDDGPHFTAFSLVAFAAVLGLAPLLAVLPAGVVVARRAQARRRAMFGRFPVVAWVLGSGAIAASLAATAGGSSALRLGGVVLAAWLAFLAVDLIRNVATSDHRASFRDGMILALAGVASISVARAVGVGFDAGTIWPMVIPALASDASVAYAAVVLAGIATMLNVSRPWRALVALALGAVAISVSDHPEALIGIAVMVVVASTLRRRPSCIRASLRCSILVGIVPLAAVAAALGLQHDETTSAAMLRQGTATTVTSKSLLVAVSGDTVSDRSTGVTDALGLAARSTIREASPLEHVSLQGKARWALFGEPTAVRDDLQGPGQAPLVDDAGADALGSPTSVTSGPTAARSPLPDDVAATIFNQSLVVVLGVMVLLAALFGHAVKRRDLRLFALALFVAFVTIFDATVLGETVLVPLAAVVGWRRPGAVRLPAAAAAIGRRVVVVAALVATEMFVALSVLAAFVLTDTLVGAGAGVVEALLACTALWPFFSWRSGMFPGYGLSPAQELRNHVSTAGYVTVLCVLGWYAVPTLSYAPLVSLLAMLGATGLLQIVGRAATKHLLLQFRFWGRPVVILGAGELGRRVARGLRRSPLDGLHPVGFFDDDSELNGKRIEGIRVRGTIDAAHAFAMRHAVRHAIVAIPELEPERLDQLITGSSRVFWRVQYVPDLGALPTDDVLATDLDGNLALEIHNGLYQPKNRIAKRVTDMLLGSGILLLLSPVLALIWLWVRLDSRGGGLHFSPRVGEGGRPFDCLKFRTMFEDAEDRLEQMLASDPTLRAQYETWHKLEDDPRITRVGRFLRRTSLDELPQLWNVVKGDMSLVGPRPYLEREIPDMGRYAEIIHHAKPGMTGLWQIRGRSAVTFRDRLEMEARYVRNWSVWWDVVLLTQTPLALLRRGNVGR